jgi:amino acid adenylation domain-containing protein
MESVHDLLGELGAQGIELTLSGDTLQVDCPIDLEASTLTLRIKAHEDALIAHLKKQMSPAPVPSFAQQRLWFIDRLAGESTQYNQPVAIRLQGEVRQTCLQNAFDALLARHAALRTTFSDSDGQVQASVQKVEKLPLHEFDLTRLPDEQRSQRLNDILATEAHAHFDLSKDLMIRVMLIWLARRPGADDVVVSVTLHHIASDGRSVQILIREFAEAYAALLHGSAATFSPLPMQYQDYARWQRRRLQGLALDEQLNYWRSQLNGIAPLHRLPTDRKRPPQQSFEGRLHQDVIDATLGAKLTEFARSQNVTPFILLQCAFAVLIVRRTGNGDVVMGVPVAGRTHVELESVVGPFINTLVLRTSLHEDLRFTEALSLARAVVMDAMANQDIPFERLVEELKPERTRSFTPLFQILMTVQDAHVRSIKLPGLTTTLLDSQFQRSKFDLELEISPRDGGFAVRWLYAASLFDRPTIERTSAEFITLLESIIADPDVPLWQLEILPLSERQQLRLCNATDVTFPAEDTLVGMFEAQVARTPENLAATFESESLTYAELDRRASCLAQELVLRYGVGPGRRVGLAVERSLEMLVSVLAIMKAGAAYVACDSGLPQERLDFMLTDSNASPLLTRQTVIDLLGPATETRGLPNAAESLVRADSLAYVIYTSGSTGRPKGTLNLHRAVCNRIHALQRQFALTSADRLIQKTPLGFDVSVWEVFWPLSVGAAIVLARPEGHKDPQYLERAILDQGVSVVHFVPSMLHAFLNGVEAQALRGVRYVLTSGEALTCELVQQCRSTFTNAQLINHYGPTEAAIEVTCWVCDEGRSDGAVPIGAPIANTRIHILDAHDALVPIGVAGELHIAGVQVGEGYINQPELTAERFIERIIDGRHERLYRTGDIARWLGDGQIEYLGRRDAQVKLRGMRVELGEIEAHLRAQASIREAVALVHGKLASQQLICYVVPSAGAPADHSELTAQLREALNRALPAYVRDCVFVVLESMPLSQNGKIDRLGLPPPSSVRAGSSRLTTPATSTERQVRAIWASVLGRPPEEIGVDESFFEIGGSSLLTLSVQSQLRNLMGADVSVAHLFEHPTVALLSCHISGETQRAADRSSALEGVGRRLRSARARRDAERQSLERMSD